MEKFIVELFPNMLCEDLDASSIKKKHEIVAIAADSAMI
jgi:hypothetical protein